MSRALIVAAGDPAGRAGWAALEVDLVICADGGLSQALAAGLRPDLVVGDMDSTPQAEVEAARALGVEILEHPQDKDQSDLELALEEALRRGAREALIVGGLGRRLDHTLVTVMGVLPRLEGRGLRVRLLGAGVEVWLARAGETRSIAGRQGWRCTLVSLTRQTRLRLRGFRYELDPGVLLRASSTGLSNLIRLEEASLTLDRGELLVILTDPAAEDLPAPSLPEPGSPQI